MKQTHVSAMLLIVILVPAADAQVFKGKLEKKKEKSKAHLKTHKVTLNAKTPYYISMTSTQFDTLVVVKDAKGTEMARNDDGGVALNALLQFTPPTSGAYRIEARSFADQERRLHIARLEKSRTSKSGKRQSRT